MKAQVIFGQIAIKSNCNSELREKKIFLSKIGALDDVFWKEITRMCEEKKGSDSI